MKCKQYEAIGKMSDIEVYMDIDLKKHSTMKLDAKGDLIVIKSIKALKVLLKYLYKEELQYLVLGWGANQIFPPRSPLPYLKLSLPFDFTFFDNAHESYKLPANISLAKLTAHASRFGLKGWEAFTGIPATLGGAIVMNAGTGLGEIGPLIKTVRLISSEGEERLIETNESSFIYRSNNFIRSGEVIVEAEMIHYGQDKSVAAKIKKYLEYRNSTQPMKANTCGCMFKNSFIDTGVEKLTCRAGHSVDILGLKGFLHEGLRVNTIHGNFLENLGGASSLNVQEALSYLQREMQLHLGVSFEPEIKIP
jgi:UDP-N-acetylmuramate dehydrogenase